MKDQKENVVEPSKKDKKSLATTKRGTDHSYNKPKSGEKHPYSDRGE